MNQHELAGTSMHQIGGGAGSRCVTKLSDHRTAVEIRGQFGLGLHLNLARSWCTAIPADRPLSTRSGR